MIKIEYKVLFFKYCLALKALKIKNIPMELANFVLWEARFSPQIVYIACVNEILTFLDILANIFDYLITFVWYCMFVLIVPVSVNVPELLRMFMEKFRVNDISVLHISLIVYYLLNDTPITSKIR